MDLYSQLPGCALSRWTCLAERREGNMIGHGPPSIFFAIKTRASPATDRSKGDGRNDPCRAVAYVSLLVIRPWLEPIHLGHKLVGILVRGITPILGRIQIDRGRIACG